MKKYNAGNEGELLVRAGLMILGKVWDPLENKFTELGDLLIPGNKRRAEKWREPLLWESAQYKQSVPLWASIMQKIVRKESADDMIREMYSVIDLPCETAPANMKADVVTRDSKGNIGAYNVENTARGDSSWLNASKATRVRFEITRNGGTLTAEDETFILSHYGVTVTGRGKTRAQRMASDGFDFKYHSFASKEFACAAKHIEKDLAAFCKVYLLTGSVRLTDVFSLFPEEEWYPTVGFIRRTILRNAPTKRARLSGHYKGATKSGVILILPHEKRKDQQVQLFQSSSIDWWDERILAGGRFDGPATGAKRCDWGYAYRNPDDGRILFDYALNIRGSFGNLAR